MTKRFPLYMLLTLLVATFATTACNSDDDDDDYDITNTYSLSTTLVTSFTLEEDDSVLSNLDSVYFTIDPDRGLIYNADSLPYGTNVSAVCASIEFSSTVSSAMIKMTGSSVHNDTTISYTGTSDSIDFTGNVVMTVTSFDGTAKRDYTIKVNVHQQEPDSLYWSDVLRHNLPNAVNPAEQHTVKKGDTFYCLVYENDGTYTLSTSTDPSADTWTKATVNFPFTPSMRTFTATTDALYILDDNNELYKSTDGLTWTDCSIQWSTISGYYDTRLLGVLRDGTSYYHDEYPRSATPTAIEEDFPVSDASPMVFTSNTWVVGQQGVIAGGKYADGTASNSVWGFDGNGWGRINKINTTKALPGLIGPIIFPYYTHSVSTSNFVVTTYVTWFVLGGRLNDGSYNETVYTSRDQGLLWIEGDDLVQLPESMSIGNYAQVFIETETLTDNASKLAGWNNVATRKLPVWASIDNSVAKAMAKASAATAKGIRRAPSVAITSWECPYIYIFGGSGVNGLNNSIYKGVINRLTYKPIF